MQGMVSFDAMFPEVAEKEIRSAFLVGGDGRPEYYAFVEHYCIEDGCDCRRVEIFVRTHTRGHVASISHAFEPPRPGSPTEDMGQTFLDPMNKQSRESKKILELFIQVLDDEYQERLKRHYRMVKDAIADPDHAVHQTLADAGIGPRKKAPRRSLLRLVSRTDPCPCGSGKRYRNCCKS